MVDLSWLPAADEKKENDPLSFLPKKGDAAQSAIDIGSRMDPDAEARRQTLVEETGAPMPLVRQQEDKILKLRDKPTINDLADSPRTRAFFESLPNAAVAHDDHKSLTRLEKLWDDLGRGKGAMPYLREIGGNIKKSWGVGKQTVELGKMYNQKLTNIMRGERDPLLEYQIGVYNRQLKASPEDENVFESILTGGTEMSPLVIDSIIQGQAYGLEFGAIAFGVGMAVNPPMARKLATKFYTGGVKFGMLRNIFMIESGLAFKEFEGIQDENGVPLDPKIAGIAALTVGAANATLEQWGLSQIPGADRVLGRVGKSQVALALKSPTVRKALMRVAGKYAWGISANAMQEAAQEATVIIAREIAKETSNKLNDTNFRYTAEDLGPRMWESFKEGAAGAAFLGVPGSAVNLSIDVGRSAVTQDFKEASVKFNQAINESKILKRSPAATKRFLDMLGAGDDVYIDSVFYQSDPGKAAPILEKLGVTPEKAQEAIDNGHDIPVGYSVLNTKLSPEEYNTVIDDVKPAPGALTTRDVNAIDLNKEVEKVSGQLEDERKTRLAVSRETARIRKEGIRAGYSPQEMKDHTDSLKRFAEYAGYDQQQTIDFLKKPKLRRATGPSPGAMAQEGKVSIDTPEFKTWFGKSKVVDETGAPLQVYHGTLKGFDAFKLSDAGTMIDRALGTHLAEDPNLTNAFSIGGYVFESDSAISDTPEASWYREKGEIKQDGIIAIEFDDGRVEAWDEKKHGPIWKIRGRKDARLKMLKPGGRVMPLYVRIENPIIVDNKPNEWDQIAVAKEIADVVFQEDRQLFIDQAMRNIGYQTEEIAGKIWDDIKSGKGYNYYDDVMIYNFKEFVDNHSALLNWINPGIVREKLKAAGYDGVIYNNTSPTETVNIQSAKSYIVIDPAQVKSVFNTGAWSRETPDILFQADVTPIFYSQLLKFAEAKWPARGRPAELLDLIDTWIKKGEFKEEEVDFIGLREEIKKKTGPIGKKDIIAFIRNNQLDIDEVDIEKKEVPDFWDDESVWEDARERFQEDWSNGEFYDDYVRDAVDDEIRDAWDNPKHQIWTILIKDKSEYEEIHTDEDGDIDDEAAFDEYEEDVNSGLAYHEILGDYEYELEEQAWDANLEYYMERAIEYAREQWEEEGEGSKFSEYNIQGGKEYTERLFIFNSPKMPPLPEYLKKDLAVLDNYRWRLITKYGDNWDRKLTPAEKAHLDYVEKKYEESKTARNFLVSDKRFSQGHWDDYDNVIFHTRFDERIDENGKKTLFIIELQSDWHKYGKREGFSDYINDVPEGWKIEKTEDLIARTTPTFFWHLRDEMGLSHAYTRAKPDMSFDEIKSKLLNKYNIDQAGGIPPAPLKKDWPMYIMKRMVRYAAEEGFDRIALASGAVQLKIYPGLQKDFRRLIYNSESGEIIAYPHDQRAEPVVKNAPVKDVDLYIGKDAADKLMAKSPDEYGWREISGNEFKLGGKGMRAFYDRGVPREMGNFFRKKKWGNPNTAIVGIETKDHPTGFEPVFSMEITEKMKEKAIGEGFPLFQKEGEGKPPRGALLIGNNQYIIELFQKADRSTIWHETAHIYFNEIKSAVESGAAPERIAEDYRKIRTWLDLAEGEEFTTAHQETFARGFEAYLWEGKAPNAEMAGVFQRFKTWLRSVYKRVQELNVTLNGDIRGVFDRMLTDGRRVEESAILNGFTMPDKAHLDTLGVVAEDRNYMQRLIKQAYDKAEIAMVADRDKNRRAQMKKWRALVDQEIEEDPVYKFVDALSGGEGLNRAIIANEYGEDTVAKMPPRTVKAGGLNPAEGLPDMFASVDDMIEALSNLPTKKEYKKMRLDALAASHDAKYMPVDYLASTKEFGAFYEILAKYSDRDNRGVTPRKAFSSFAEKKMQTMKVRDAINTGKYLAAMKKHSRLEADKARQGKWDEAADANEKMRMNYEFARQSIKHRKLVEKVQRRIKKITASKTIDEDYLDNIKILGTRFGLPAKVTTRKTKDIPGLAKLFETNELIDTGGLFPDFIMSERETVDYRELTIDEFEDVWNAIRFLEVRGRAIKEGYLSDRSITLKEVAGRIAGDMAGLNNLKVWEANGAMEFLTDLERSYFAHLDSLPFVTMAMGGYQDLKVKGPRSFASKQITDRLSDAQGREYLKFKEIWAQMLPHIHQLIKARKRLAKTYGKKIMAPGAAIPELLRRNGYTRGLTADQIFAIALNMGNEGNRARLLKGYDTTEADIKAWTDVLEKKDWDAIQGIWDTINSLYDELNGVHRRVNGFSIKKVAADPFQTKFGEYPGGYYPAKYDFNLTGKGALKAAGFAEIENLMSLQSGEAIRMIPATKSGMTKERTGVTDMPLMLATNVAASHIRDVVHYITHAEVVNDIDRITRHPLVIDEVQRHLGPKVYNMIRPALRHIARPARDYESDIDRWVEVARAHTTPFILAINALVAAKQIFSLPGGMRDVGELNYIRGLSVFLTKRPSKIIAEIYAMSNYMAERAKAFDRELMQQFTLLKPNARAVFFGGKAVTLEDIRNFGFAPIRLMDSLAVIPLWHGAYQRHMRETGIHEDSVKYADSIVRNSQPSSQSMDFTAWQRLPGVPRFFSMFSTFTVGKYRQRFRAHYRAFASKKLTIGEYFHYLISDSFLPGLAMTTAVMMLQGRDFEDDEDLLAEIIKGTLSYTLLTGLPLVEGLFSAYGGPLDTPVSAGPDEFKNMIRYGFDLFNSKDDNDDVWEKLGWSVFHVISYALKVPVSKLVKKAISAEEDKKRKGVIKYIIPTPKRYQ